ncbi:MAG: hypothetical protein LBR27_11215 [Bifidobacteriaceae bacterium]|nr:hypothetical protein [Bifidobacteriaceae bacterium]
MNLHRRRRGLAAMAGLVAVAAVMSLGAAGPAQLVLRQATAEELLGPTGADQAEWFCDGLAGVGARASLYDQALADLAALTAPDGALVAAAAPAAWAYVWPRDAAFGAAALAVSGHFDQASAVLGFLQQVQGADGRFEARYHQDGTPVDDGRPAQLDGTGWALWAYGQVMGAAPADRQAQVAAQFEPLVTRSADAIEQALAGGWQGLVSSDYWERRETIITLGTVAPLRAGALAIGRTDLVAGLDQVLAAYFQPFGYPRYAKGSDLDAAAAMLAPAFQGEWPGGAATAGLAAERALARPAGGLAPGEGWRRDGVSWTPETALFAYAWASAGQAERAESWLTWLDQHRTDQGSLSEKVLADGSPAGPAPLSWTAALVVLAGASLGELAPASEVAVTCQPGEAGQ